MSSLLIATLCSASIALLFKLSESRDCNRYAVTSANYFVALALSLVMMVLGGEASVPDRFDGPVRFSVFFGAFVGIAFYAGYILFQVSIRRHGAAITSAFGKMGVMVPMVLSLIIWHEQPEALQWVGIALAFGAVVVVCLPGLLGGRRELESLLLILLLVMGICEFTTKVYQKYGTEELKGLFFAVVFLCASLLSLVEALRRRKPAGLREMVIGGIIGIPNIFQVWFLIEALGSLPATLAFPVFSAGSIVLISLGGYFFFGERFSSRDKLALMLVLPALILINL